jgi:hypothetical protein
MKGGLVRNFKAYNDLIALFNTIPALITFSNPGFSSRGYELKEGRADFHLAGDILTFDMIHLKGKSSTIAGRGTINLKTKKLDIDLGIQTAREVGKVLGSIPLVGYIIFGKDKSLTTGVKITGTVDKPVVKTHPIAEALVYPLHLFRRTITSPASLGGSGEKAEQKSIPEKKKSRTKKSPLFDTGDTF